MDQLMTEIIVLIVAQNAPPAAFRSHKYELCTQAKHKLNQRRAACPHLCFLKMLHSSVKYKCLQSQLDKLWSRVLTSQYDESSTDRRQAYEVKMNVTINQQESEEEERDSLRSEWSSDKPPPITYWTSMLLTEHSLSYKTNWSGYDSNIMVVVSTVISQNDGSVFNRVWCLGVLHLLFVPVWDSSRSCNKVLISHSLQHVNFFITHTANRENCQTNRKCDIHMLKYHAHLGTEWILFLESFEGGQACWEIYNLYFLIILPVICPKCPLCSDLFSIYVFYIISYVSQPKKIWQSRVRKPPGQ